MAKKVTIKNTKKANVGITVPELKLKRDWNGKGDVKTIDLEVLKEALYEDGVNYLFKTGILYIEDMKDKIALGLEEEGTQEPTNVISLTDNQMKRLLKVAAFDEFKETCKNLSREQMMDLAQFAIENKLFDSEKAKYIKARTEINIMKGIELDDLANEDGDTNKE